MKRAVQCSQERGERRVPLALTLSRTAPHPQCERGDSAPGLSSEFHVQEHSDTQSALRNALSSRSHLRWPGLQAALYARLSCQRQSKGTASAGGALQSKASSSQPWHLRCMYPFTQDALVGAHNPANRRTCVWFHRPVSTPDITRAHVGSYPASETHSRDLVCQGRLQNEH